jgi:hypothetical protein
MVVLVRKRLHVKTLSMAFLTVEKERRSVVCGWLAFMVS